MATRPAAPLAFFVLLTACNSVVFPSFGGSDEPEDGRTMPSPSGPYPTPPSPQTTACALPDGVTASGTLVREGTDPTPPVADAGDASDAADAGDAEPAIDPAPSSYDVDVVFSVRGGNGISFGRAPTCVGCTIVTTSFHSAGGRITIRIPHDPGSSSFAAAAIKVPFDCGRSTAMLTLKVLHPPNDARVTVEGYATH